ncbi:P-loop containing nucleoside triphosphate hydrolase protein [Hortaea werneckii]|uniref:Kinesin-like protein n=1 Tax=Hortaea werneckii TaxID=91943 RepID=A0A3M7JB62_HORWE|nr:P-loop containing nucleoside triphosphate hydrolase protein [Hortaea werneckii]KAI6829240.1 P-loop containing nucleoside triphosphate hydrolase protein [Hortaea werneckii]KAI6925246.1 P-loop containing nucleoside triphosphate hydrolase protein [Hortaea werneckii]KAI6933144.1 P-loop containing nucleoside triphosphate hydrolase protein [Hortaea werneckii]KAI6967529.1 P-loop containing nucleoside triphosphate hydrolase protein [Hortaea werneckii]
MEQSRPSAALFDVYLRLRPSASAAGKERFLDVEETRHAHQLPTHITIKPPADDKRKRAIEKFGFTRVFEERCGQRELLENIGILPILEGVLGQPGREGRDGLLATLGVTGSGKSHTILGSKSQRGITQLALDVLYRHTAPTLVDADYSPSAFSSLCQADVSEGHLLTASNFLDSIYYGGDVSYSRAATPGMETSFMSMPAGPRRNIPRVSNLANHPHVEDIEIAIDRDAEYAVVVSMYEVHNDRIYDLLASSSSSAGNKQQQQQQQAKRRALLFKSTEKSPDRKVVAGLKKVVCSTLEEALLVLETGLTERRVAGTGSNAVSSRSHGFFNIEIKKRARSTRGIPVSGPWTTSTLTIVDLAGSERARAAKTAGATLAEAGKINESLMYLGQCMQLQADQAQGLTNANVVPFRQCKLTELLFSNSLGATGGKETGSKKAPQKAVMIVTADPLGDYNATSQILRYSALAREVTVPRVPSLTSQIASAPVMPSNLHGHPTGRATPSNNTAAVQEELEQALAIIASLRSELEVSQLLLQEETQRRQEAEASWKVAETRIDEVEAEVREEMWEEFESRLALEQRRWRAARDAEMDAQDQHLDRKLEVLTQGMTIYEDETAEKENLEGFDDDDGESDVEGEGSVPAKSERSRANGSRAADLDVARLAEAEAENAVLREKVANAERSKETQRSPSKKMRVLKTPSKGWRGSGVELWE